MKHDTGKRSLEGFKLFPVAAWLLTIGFAFFVYHIVKDLQQVTADLQAQSDALQERIDTNNPQADFDAYRR